MSTLSTNQIVVEYIIKEGDIRKAQQDFDKLTEAEKRAIVQTQKLNTTLQETGKQGKDSTDKVSGGLNNVGGIASKLGPLLAGAFSIAAISAFTKQVVETTIKFEGYYKAIEFASGSSQNFARNQEFLNNLIQKYGLGLAQTTEAYKQFFTASTLAGQSQQETNKQFEAVTKAGTVLKLTTDQMQGAFLALGQMMSKGTVQAEELRGQLGERIPGAFSLMAKALNVNERQLNKMLEQGQVLSKDALPAFAAELEKTFGAASQKNLNGMVNSQNRFNSSIDTLILAVGNRLQPFLKGAYDLAAGIANQIARAAGAEKKASTENLGLKKAEADIAQLILKVSQDQGVWINRKKAATQLLFKIESEIYKASVERENAKINKDKLAEKRAKAKVNLLQDEELALTKIAGIEIFSAKKKEELTEKELKALADAEKKRMQALEKEYRRKVELLELDKQIAAEKIKQTVSADGQKIAMMELEFATNLKLLKVSKEYADKNVKQAKDQAKILPAIIKTQNQEITQAYIDEGIKEREARVEGEDQTQKAIYDAKLKAIERNKVLQETLIGDEKITGVTREKEAFIRSEKLILNEINANKEIIAANDEAANNGVESALNANDKILADNAKLYRELAALRKKDVEDRKKKDAEIVQASAQVASELLNGFMNLQAQRTQNELTALSKRYDEEIRLAGDNAQKVNELNEKRKQEEKEIRTKQFKAQQTAAVAEVIFRVAPIIAQQIAGVITAPLAIASYATAAAQIGFILAQPVPEFAEGTKGKPFKGGKAIVGEIGKEWVVTTSGQVYETPGVATLVDLPKGSQVIPNKDVVKAERFMGSKMMSQSRGDSGTGQLVERLMSIENTLSKLPITSLTMDERGFTKKIQTKTRETKILNNRFGN